MPENRFQTTQTSACSRMPVSIETNKIMDSCRDRDCFENSKVMLTDFGNEIINHTCNIRVKNAYISRTYITAEPVQFNRGFYNVDIRFFVKLECEACMNPGNPQCFDGIAVLDKHVILYGGESDVNTFKSSCDSSFCSVQEPCNRVCNNPDVVIDVLDPIVLSCKVMENRCPICSQCIIPDAVLSQLDGNLCECGDKYLAVSFGIFSVIRMTRPAQYIVNGIEYNIPDKECVQPDVDDPCGSFRSMPFPTAAFGTGNNNSLGMNTGSSGKCSCGS